MIHQLRKQQLTALSVFLKSKRNFYSSLKQEIYVCDVLNYALTQKDALITTAATKFSENLQENCFQVTCLQMHVNQCTNESMEECFSNKFAGSFSLNCPYVVVRYQQIDLEKATGTLFCSGESPKGLGRDIFYVASRYMLRRERKISHFGVVGEREEDE